MPAVTLLSFYLMIFVKLLRLEKILLPQVRVKLLNGINLNYITNISIIFNNLAPQLSQNFFNHIFTNSFDFKYQTN